MLCDFLENCSKRPQVIEYLEDTVKKAILLPIVIKAKNEP